MKGSWRAGTLPRAGEAGSDLDVARSGSKLERVRHEIAAQPQADRVDAMGDPKGNMGRDGDAQPFELALRHMQRRDRDHRIGRTMDQQHRRFGKVTVRQLGGPGEHSRIAHDRRDRLRSAQRDMKRHHRPLAEANQREIRLGQAILRELAVDEGVDRRRRQ